MFRRYLEDMPIIAMVSSAAVLLIALAPPFLPSGAAEVVMTAFSFVCHQLPDRSPFIDGIQAAICHRCLGIYCGIFAGAVIFPFLDRWGLFLMRWAGAIIAVSLAVPGADWLGEVIGIWTNIPASRIITGAVFGITAGFYFARATMDIVRSRRSSEVVPSA